MDIHKHRKLHGGRKSRCFNMTIYIFSRKFAMIMTSNWAFIAYKHVSRSRKELNVMR